MMHRNSNTRYKTSESNFSGTSSQTHPYVEDIASHTLALAIHMLQSSNNVFYCMQRDGKSVATKQQ